MCPFSPFKEVQKSVYLPYTVIMVPSYTVIMVPFVYFVGQ